MNQPHATADPDPVARLEGIIRSLTAAQHELAALAGKHREALRAADGVRITALAFERDMVNARIVTLNRERMEAVGAIATSLGLDARRAATLTVRELLGSVGEPAASSLIAAADELRSALLDTQREHSVLRDATAAVAGQLGGVLTRVLSACSTANTYTAGGQIAVGAAVPGTLDMRH
ncbi:MAG: flagellar export chaperone FlgN [Planctomycetota bacterium]